MVSFFNIPVRMQIDGTTLWNGIVDWLKNAAPIVLKSLLILLIGWWLSGFLTRLISKAMEKGKAEAGARSFISSVCKSVFRIIVLISTASALGINVTSIIAALGAAGLTIGLALKDSLSNFASGVIILFTKPFKTGDFMEVDGLTGTVKKIDLMYTTLSTVDNKAILLPNSTVTASKIINYTAEPSRRLDLEFSISYNADIALAKKVIASVVRRSELAYETPAPVIAVTAHNDSSVSVSLFVWCDSPNYLPLKFELMEDIKLAFDENGIEIPFPQLDVHMRSNGDSPQKSL